MKHLDARPIGCTTHRGRRAQIGERDRCAMREPPDVERERSQTLMRRKRSTSVRSSQD
jgi:hypothetical protein